MFRDFQDMSKPCNVGVQKRLKCFQYLVQDGYPLHRVHSSTVLCQVHFQFLVKLLMNDSYYTKPTRNIHRRIPARPLNRGFSA